MGGKPWRPRCGLAGCAIAVEDEVFEEEEESAEVEGDSARPCHLSATGGGGFNRLRAFRSLLAQAIWAQAILAQAILAQVTLQGSSNFGSSHPLSSGEW